MRSRSLVLRKETLGDLTAEELAGVVGGSDKCILYTVLPTGCVCSGMYPSLNIDCDITGAPCR